MEWFDHRNHICMVFELLGQSVFDFLKSNQFKPFPHSQIQQLAKQLFTSVACKFVFFKCFVLPFVTFIIT